MKSLPVAPMRACVLAVLLLCAAVSAFAERYTREGDIYFHSVADCMGEDHPEIVDGDVGLYPCPICVQDEAEYAGLEVFSIAGMTVIRMADAWMAEQTETSKPFDPWLEEHADGERERKVAHALHGDAYAAFKSAVREGETATATAREMRNYNSLSETSFVTHLGGAWYEVCGPVTWPAPYDDDLIFRFFLYSLEQTGDRLTERSEEEWNDRFAEDFADPPMVVIDEKPVWSQAFDDITADLYRTHGMDFLSIRLTGKDSVFIPRMHMRAEGWPDELTAVGVRVGEATLYGAVLSDGQAAQLMKGVDLEIRYRRRLEFTGLMPEGTFALVRTEGEYAKPIVVDDAGNVIVPQCDWIDRIGNVFIARDRETWEAMEAIGYTRDLFPRVRLDRCSVVDADAGLELLCGDHLDQTIDAHGGSFSYDTRLGCAFFVDGKRVAQMRGSDAYRLSRDKEAPDPESCFVVRGSAAIYTGRMSDALECWFPFAEDPPEMPGHCLVGAFRTRRDAEGKEASVTLIVWALDGGTPATLEALGLIDAEREPLLDRAYFSTE